MFMLFCSHCTATLTADLSRLQCPGEGVCNGSVQPESGHPRLQGAPEGLPRADQGECAPGTEPLDHQQDEVFILGPGELSEEATLTIVIN